MKDDRMIPTVVWRDAEQRMQILEETRPDRVRIRRPAPRPSPIVHVPASALILGPDGKPIGGTP